VGRPARLDFTITTESGQVHTWDWAAFQALPAEDVTVDLHCVTKWSKLQTRWRGVSLDTLMADVTTGAEYAVARTPASTSSLLRRAFSFYATLTHPIRLGGSGRSSSSPPATSRINVQQADNGGAPAPAVVSRSR
jgi:Oxidoreductase molybdopterin binding domain